jgi:hypothetical protein
MKKIKITKIADAVYAQKGFDEHGCIRCRCTDLCCENGADVDKEAYDLIKIYKERIERLSNLKFVDFFENAWSGDGDFLGGNSIRSKVGKAGFCIFRFPEQKGCILFKLALEDGLPRRIIPSICRLFPLTWNNETLEYYAREHVPGICNCLEAPSSNGRSIFETQKEAIEDIFEIRL